MHGIIPYIFDFLVDPVVHFLVLKSSMGKAMKAPSYFRITCGLFDTMRHDAGHVDVTVFIGATSGGYLESKM